MKRFVLTCTVSAIALFSINAASANDYNSGVVTKAPSVEYTDVEFGSGWYLRGDITYNFRGRSDASIINVPGVVSDISVQADYDDAVGARIGFGNYITPNFRVEVSAGAIFDSTFEGFSERGFGGQRNVLIRRLTSAATPGDPTATPPVPATPNIFTDFPDTVFFDDNGNVTGSTTGAFTAPTAPAIAGTESLEASYNATTFLVNGYYDLPTLGKFKPYVGAGAGLGRLTTNETRTFTCNPVASETCGGRFGSGVAGESTETTLVRDTEQWLFAYQLSLGTAYRIDDRTSLDIGYSYLDFAGGDEINYSDGTAVNEDGFAVHRGHIGIRYDIN